MVLRRWMSQAELVQLQEVAEWNNEGNVNQKNPKNRDIAHKYGCPSTAQSGSALHAHPFFFFFFIFSYSPSRPVG